MMSPEEFLNRFERVKPAGRDQWMARCPAHDDRTPSLHITLTPDGDWLLHDHGGCPIGTVLFAAGLTKADLFGSNGDSPRAADFADYKGEPITATYTYPDEAGRPLFRVGRTPSKSFPVQSFDGIEWHWGMNGVRRVLYRLPAVLAAVKSGQTIYVVEGEKDVHAIEKVGGVATCNPGGAGKWRDDYTEALRGANVIVVADRDDTGRDHAEKVAKSLEGVAADVKVMESVGGNDTADHLAAGKTLGEFVDLALESQVSGVTVSSALGELTPDTFDTGKFRVLDVAKLIASEPPGVPWRVKGFAVDRDVTILTGDPGAGKSLFALALTAATARGESVAGLECEEGLALYVDAENGAWEIHRRLHSLGVPASGVTVVEANGVNLRDEQDFEGLVALIRQHKPKLVVLDSLTALWPGANERATEDVAPTLYALKQLAEQEGVAILALHHRPKNGGNYRGTTAIAAATQIGFTLGREDSDPQQQTRRWLRCWKCRPAAEPEERWLELVAEKGMVLVDVVEPYEEPDAPERPAPVKKALAPPFLEALRDGPLRLAEIASVLGRSPKDRTLRRVAESLVAGGQVVRDDDKRYRRVSSVTAPRGNDTVTPDTSHSRAENGHREIDPEQAQMELERVQAKYGDGDGDETLGAAWKRVERERNGDGS